MLIRVRTCVFACLYTVLRSVAVDVRWPFLPSRLVTQGSFQVKPALWPFGCLSIDVFSAVHINDIFEQSFWLRYVGWNNSPCDINIQPTIKKPWMHGMAVSSLWGIIRRAYPPHPNWDANSGRTPWPWTVIIVSALALRLSVCVGNPHRITLVLS